MQNHPNLTAGYSAEIERQIKQSVAGMAHFAGSGPPSTTCSDCVHYGYLRTGRNGKIRHRKRACGKFPKLTGKHGPDVPPDTPSCRHFEPKAPDGDV